MNKSYLCGAIIVIATMVPSAVLSDQLPLKDGAYLRNTQWCPLYYNGELDFIDLEVEQDGRSFGYPEQGCLVYSVKQLRENRYQVKSDCTEVGETFQSTMLLDIYHDQTVRIDGGELHYQCKYAPYMSKMTKHDLSELRALMFGLKTFKKQATLGVPTKSPVKIQSADTTLEKRPDGFIELWHEFNGNCRGGPGNDPKTNIACGKRYDLTQKLNKNGWCYGRENESGSQYEWHICEATSNR